jgi:protein-tyrosine phosphatase
MAGSAFEAVFICTGNRFRSPLAEAVFRQATAGLPVETSSAGTLDLGAIPPLPEAVEEAVRFGLNLSGHRSRRVRGLDLAGADLVVGFERMHVVTAVVDAGAKRERTFTLPELVGLVDRATAPDEEDPIRRARAMIEEARRLRPAHLSAPPELADPLGLPHSLQRQTAERVHELTLQLAARLFG